MRNTTTYNSWLCMKARCKNKDLPRYKKYGATGITYQDDWELFSCFLRDMGERPKDATLDRIDNTKGYTKENCRWANKVTQNNNRSVCKKVTINGITRNVSEWVKISGTKHKTILQRLSRGWSDIEAVYGRIA